MKNEFKSYYENELEGINEEYVFELKNINIKYLLIGVVIASASIILYLSFGNVLSFCILFFLFILVRGWKNNMNYVSEEYKYDISSRIIAFLSDNKNAGINERVRISEKAINECELFNADKLRSGGSHYTVMSYKKFNIVLSDLSLFYYDDKFHKKDVFNGIYFSATFNKPIREQTYAIPNNIKDVVINNVMNYYDYAGTRVLLENNEFEKKYNVYSVDELQARYIISLRLMERINDIDKIFPDKKYIVFKKSGKICILFSGESIKNILNSKIKLLDDESRFMFCENVFSYFNKFLEVYKILDLENRLYMLEV